MDRHLLRLYVAGTQGPSRAVIDAVCRLAQEHLDRCDVEIIDVLREPDRAAEDDVIATPTLVKREPRPVVQFLVDPADTPELLLSLLQIQ